MSNGKYTPGPWQVQRQGSFNYLVQSSSGSICSVRCEENADLIASAPELLEALKAIVEIIHNVDAVPAKQGHPLGHYSSLKAHAVAVQREFFERAEKAIAKAEGVLQ